MRAIVLRMHGRSLTWLLSLLLAVSGGMLASQAKATEIQRVVSDMGIEAWLVEEHSIPLISLNFAFEGGAANDPLDRLGVANMASALLDEGAGDMDAQAFQGRMEDLAMRMGFDVGRDNFFGEMKTLTRNRDEAVGMLTLAINSPRFDETATERIRAQLLSSIRQRKTDPETLASQQWSKVVFGDHPYGRPVAGTEETVTAITRDDLLGVIGRLFARDRLHVSVVGDITAAELKGVLDKVFGTLPASTALEPISNAVMTAGPRRDIIDMDIPQTVIQFGFEGIDRHDPDFMAAFIVNEILGGGGFNSRLYDEVREKRGLAYSVYTGLYPLNHAAIFIGGVATQNERAAESLATIESELARLAQDGPSAQELRDSKDYLTGSYALRFDTSDKIASQLVAIQLDRLGIDYINRRNSLVEAVTIEDVQRVARRLLKPGALITTVVGRPQGLEAIAPVEH